MDIIIGHITKTSAKIWLKGSEKYRYGFITYQNSTNSRITQAIYLGENTNHINVVELSNLTQDTGYDISLSLAETPDGKQLFSHNTPTHLKTDSDNRTTKFLLGSCNLQSLNWLAKGDKYIGGINELLDSQPVDFTLHVGDQIYADVPFLWRYYIPFIRIKPQHYYKYYQDSWDRPEMSKFLARTSHYMIFDDHEMIDNFSNDKRRFTRKFAQLKASALYAYKLYVHNRQPETYGKDVFYYSYSKNGAEFFVLDTRTNRSQEEHLMIDKKQMRILLHWLTNIPSDATKFIVTPCAFIGEARTKYGADDKWGGKFFRMQKEEIIDYISEHNIQKIVFLTGDMHNSYHAKMLIDQRVTVHELMSSPINQVQFSKAKYYRNYGQISTTRTKNNTIYKSEIIADSFFRKRAIMRIEATDNEVSFAIHELKKHSHRLQYEGKIKL